MRLVATDIDGTILPPSGVFSERTRAALASLAEVGIPLVLVTARPPRWIDAVAAQLGIEGEAVCANGAVFYDLATRSVIDHQPIDGEAVIEVARLLREVLPGVILGLETTKGVAFEPGFPTLEVGVVPRETAPLELMESSADGTAVKMLARLPGSTPDAMLAAALPLVGHLLEPSTSSRTDPLLELAPRGVTKASGLAHMAAKHGVAAVDVVAFGDALNDIPMLEWVGRSVAVANAHADVLKVAGEVTAAVGDDGVAIVVEQIVAAARAGL